MDSDVKGRIKGNGRYSVNNIYKFLNELNTNSATKQNLNKTRTKLDEFTK